MRTRFVRVFDPKKFAARGYQTEEMLDWGEYSSVQGAANLSAELLSRWKWNYPVNIDYDTEAGGAAGGCIWHVVADAMHTDGPNGLKWKGTGNNAVPLIESGTWIKEPKWKPADKGIVLVGHFQVISAKLAPIPFHLDYLRQWFGCRKNKQTKDVAVEKVLRGREICRALFGSGKA
jgi:hypothetical protein